MRASSLRRPTPDLPSSPPAPVFVGIEGTGTPDERLPSSPNANIESALSETETLGPSSPDLPPLSAPPRLGPTPRTPGSSNPTSDGTFYTASWGSPYEIPSNSALWSRNHRHRSSTASLDDIEEDSPNPQFGLSHLLSSRLPQTFDITPTRPNTPSHLVLDEETPRSSKLAGIGQQFGNDPSRKLEAAFAKYSRPGPSTWTALDQLRESSGINTFSDWVNSKVLQGSAEPKEDSLAKRHRSRKSNLTLRQEDILPSLPIQQRPSAMDSSKYATPPKAKTGQPTSEGPDQFSLQPASPSVTNRANPRPLGERAASTLSVPASSNKKRVTYKGKSCWISMPVDPHRGGEGYAPVPLSLSEVAERLARFEEAGYDTRGFGHWRTTNKEKFPEHHAQNMAIFPDPAEQHKESKNRNYRVRFADKGAWDDYVRFLTEEKLRSLGVSLDAPEEIPMSRQASASQFSSHPFSPPLPTSSAGSQRIGPAGNVFPTGFIPGSSNHTSTRSIASPISSIGNPRASLHMHRQSMYASPSMAPQHSMSPPGFTSWSPQPFGSHHAPLTAASPAISSGRPDLRSPISPFSAATDGAGPFPFAQRDELLAQMQRQQQQHLLNQQQQMLPVRPASTLQEVPEAETEEERALQTRFVPEIVNPKPGHRHNISAKLEENVSRPDYRAERVVREQPELPNEMIQKESGEVESLPPPKSTVAVPEWRKNAPPLAPESSDDPVHAKAENTNNADELKENEGEGTGRSYGLDQTLSEADAHTTDNEHDKNLGSGLASSTISNPWENDSTFQPKADSTKPIAQRHSSKFSLSKLNVEAREFNPRANPSATFNPGIFSSSSFAFQPAQAKPFVPRSAREFSPGAPAIVNGSHSTFNVNAPAFSPSSISGMSSSEFSFAAKGPAFKPTAPVFQPKSFGLVSDRSAVTSDSDNSNRIFSNLNFADIVKPTKSSAAVPILLPSLQEREQNNGLREDEDGRITQDTVKRARRFGDDGDDVPQFAMPDPLPHSQASLLSNEVEDDEEDLHGNAANEMSTTLVMEEADAVAGAEAEATAAKLDDRVLTPISTEDIITPPIVLDQTLGMPSPVGQGKESPGVSSLEDEAEFTPTMSQPEMMQTSRITSASSALSALARPFEFQSTFEATGQSTPEKQTRDIAEPLLSPPSSSTAFRSDAEHAERRLTDNIAKRSPSRLPSSVRYYDDQEQPSFQEIDAVMQQFNEGGSDFGVERDDRSWPDSSVKDESTRQFDGAPEFTAKLRSDAPSPSPRRGLLRPIIPVDLDSASVTQDPFSDARAAAGSDSPIRRLNDPDAVPVSDWDEFVSSGDDERIRSQGKFLDSHVSELINGVLHQRLHPVETQLQMIRESLAAISTGDRSKGRVRSRDTIDSDADDEDDVETDLNSRSWSPKRDRRMDKFKAAVQDALVNHHRNISPSPRSVDLVGVLEALADVKLALSESTSKIIQVDDVKTAVDAAVAQHHLAFAQSRAVTDGDDEATSQISAKYMEAVARAAEETEVRKTIERREAETQRMLKLTEEELSLLGESSRDDSQRLHALEEEHRSSRTRLADAEADRAHLQKNMVSMSESNAALKATLEEYRTSHTKWREDMDRVNHDKERLAGAFGALKIQSEEAVRIRETMRERLEKLQTDATSATGKLMDERAKWQRADAEHRTRYEILRNQVQAEARTRERLETELERLEVQEREAMKLRAILEHAQQEKNRLQADVESLLVKEREAARAAITLEHLQRENAKLEELVDTLRNESSEHEKAAEKYAREYREARETGRVEVQRTRMLLQADIEAANSHVNVIRADLESELNRVRGELESARMDSDSARAKQELIFEQEADSKRDAIREVIEGKTSALHEQKLAFEERLEDLRKQHRRDLDHVIENKNQAETFLKESHAQRLAELEQHHQRMVEQALEDKDRAEAFFTDRLTLDSSRIEHLEDKIIHLEEKLEISKSAAQAAVHAAQSAKAPAASSISMALRAPERTGISAQALRESLAVLQDQLQEREIRIESMEQELSEVDKDLPEKLRARDTEIGWLRELLGVRVDDLSELVEILGQENFSRDAVRNAAIRIRAGLQMEMHEKERQANGGGSLSAVPTNLASSIQSFASPRAAQLARAIGEWRNTPSRSRSPTSQSFLAGLMTPPASNLRRTPPASSTSELSLGSAASSSKALGNPLSVRQEKSKAPLVEPPSTPPLLRKASYDQDAVSGRYSSSGFYDDEDSTVDGTPRAERKRSFGPHSPQSQRR